MSLGLDYRFTFITVNEEPMAQVRRRANSAPPRPDRAGLEAACTAKEQEVKDGLYVQSLERKMEPVFQSNAPEAVSMEGIDTKVVPSLAPVTRTQPCNPGSAGHPELCRRPCIYFAMGQCNNSDDCSFCHMGHNNRSATLDKTQRQLIKEMTHREFLSMILRVLQAKSVDGCFSEEAQDVLLLFKSHLAQMKVGRSKVPQARIMNLEKAISRMTFFSVASLTSRVNLDRVFLDECKDKVGALRQKIDSKP